MRILGYAAVSLVALTGAVSADGYAVTPPAPPVVPELGTAAEFSMWAQGLTFTNKRADGVGDTCDDLDDDFCIPVAGLGANAGVMTELDGGIAVLGDVTFDYHHESDTDGTRDSPAIYGAAGIHVLGSMSASGRLGGFAMLGGGTTHDDDEEGLVFAGLGGQYLTDDYFIQVGGAFNIMNPDGDPDETFDQIYFVRGGTQMDMGAGVLDVSGLLGSGDFDGNSDDTAQGHWVQIAATYSAPLSGNLHWFAGYQGDYLGVVPTEDRCDDRNSVFAHSIRLGLTIPLGGGLPVDTPNLRAPLTYSDEMNDYDC